MTELEVANSEFVMRVVRLDRLSAFQSELRALAHVAGVQLAADDARRWWHGWRAPGTHVPGIITAGTYYDKEGRVFWDVHDPERAVAVLLRDERYVKLVVEVEDPRATVAALEAALNSAASQ